jgi:inosine-uridine nucleoside N-ribohydrolase
MGGIFNDDYPDKGRVEWNVSGDLLATEIVYQTPVSLHRSVGLEVTEQVGLSADDVLRQFTAPLLQPVLDFAEIWFDQFYPFITFHDPLAAATVFDPTLCEYRQGTVSINRTNNPRLTHFAPGVEQAPHQVAASVDVGRYFDHFYTVFAA